MKLPLSLPSWAACEDNDPGQAVEVAKDDPVYGEGITLVADDGFETTTITLTPGEAARLGQELLDIADVAPWARIPNVVRRRLRLVP